jgi:hypothetical protein
MRVKVTFDIQLEEQKLIAADLGFQGEASRLEIEEWVTEKIQNRISSLRDTFSYVIYNAEEL